MLTVVVHRLPSALKKIISPINNEEFDETVIIDDQDALFQNNYIKLSNDQPIQVCISVQKNIQVYDLIKKIISIKEVNIDPDSFEK
jgi:hypothetical protein